MLLCRAPDHYLPASLLPDQPDIFDRDFGAVARASGHTHLGLVRRVEVLQAALQLDPGVNRVLHAEPAELGPDAGLHHADALRIRLSGRHAEIRPDLRQIALPDAEQVDALAARDLHHAHVVLLRDVG